jgi:hypothetical protein
MQNQAMMLINTLLLVMAIALMALPARSHGGQVPDTTPETGKVYIAGYGKPSNLLRAR